MIKRWLGDLDNICIVIPCDSMEAWVVAAYDEIENAEYVEDPWINVIAKKKSTVRQTAKRFGISKSTVHMVVTK